MKNLKKRNIDIISYMIFLVTAISITFRNSISTIFGNTAGIIALFPLVIVGVLFFISFPFKKHNLRTLFLIFYIFYLLLLCFLFFVLSECGGIFTPFIGFSNLSMLIIFWIFILYYRRNNYNVKFFLAFFVFLGSVNAVGAIIQFYASIDIFGFITNGIYANENVAPNVTKRAISFISSPQSLSLFLGFVLSLLFDRKYNHILGWSLRFIIAYAGLLTVSKAFFVYIFIFIIFNYLSIKKIHIIIVFIFVCLFFMFLFKERVERIFLIFEFLYNPEKYPAYNIWKDSIIYGLKFPEIFFGQGLGIFSRGSQIIFNHSLLHGSTESYFIQVFVETGILGLFFLLGILVVSIFRLWRFERSYAAILVALSSVGLFTPALYGYISGFYYYFFIVLGICSGVNEKTSLKAMHRN